MSSQGLARTGQLQFERQEQKLFAALWLLAFVCTLPFIFSSLHTPRGKPNCRLIGIPGV